MGKDKKKVIIIAIVAIILIVLAIGVMLFFTTDIFKSDQELFFKYLAQNMDVVEQYLQDPNKSKMDTLKSSPYTVNSNISFDLVSSDPEIANQTTPPRNFSIEYTKNADPQNNKDSSEAKIKYLTKELFTAQYVHDGDVYAVNGINGATSTKILNIYLGVENNNLKELAQKLGIQDTFYIPNKIDNMSLTDILSLTPQEKEYIQTQLLQLIGSQTTKENYYHNKDVMIEIDSKQVKTNSYGITLTSAEYKNLLIGLLNGISQDETILNMMLQRVRLVDSQTDMTTSNIKEQIQNIAQQINTNDFQDGIKIEVYEADGKIVRTKIEKNSMQYYIFDHERANNSIRTLISLEHPLPENELNNEIQTPRNNMIDDYQIIEGSSIQQPVTQTNASTTVILKNIEIAKQASEMRE